MPYQMLTVVNLAPADILDPEEQSATLRVPGAMPPSPRRRTPRIAVDPFFVLV